MASKASNQFLEEAGDLWRKRTQELGLSELSGYRDAAMDEVYLRWIEDGRFDDLVAVACSMFDGVSILPMRMAFLIDLRMELEGRGDIERLIALFSSAIPKVLKSYRIDSRYAEEGLLGNIAGAAMRKAEILSMMHEFLSAAHRLGFAALSSELKAAALKFHQSGGLTIQSAKWKRLIEKEPNPER